MVFVPVSAVAAPHYQDPPVTQMGYTDRAEPHTAFNRTADQRMPLGTWVDDTGKTHVSRVYATFDLSRLAGQRILGGTLSVREYSAVDCAKRSVEVWETETVSATPSWDTVPEKIRKLDELTPVGWYCPGRLTLNVDAAVQDAVARQQARVTFEVSVPPQYEWNPDYGRRLSLYSPVGLTVKYNTPPVIDPAARFNGGKPCVESAPYPRIGDFVDKLQARATDAEPGDNYSMHYEYAVWPSNDPAARTVLTVAGWPNQVSTATIPAGVLVDGTTYSWQVRANDGFETSPWSGTCSFVADLARPQAPRVTSNYPPANVGIAPREPGIFTFTATDADTVGFQYGWDTLFVPGCQYGSLGQLVCPDPFGSPNTVRADALGGTVTIRIDPKWGGLNQLLVRSIDQAGNRSAETVYEFRVPYGGEPVITVVGEQPGWGGDEVTLRFSPYPGVTGTVEYTYSIDGGAPQTVAAASDGTATTTFTVNDIYGPDVSVRSRLANGWVSPYSSWSVRFGGPPAITVLGEEPEWGEEVTLRFSPHPSVMDTVEYTYYMNYDPPQTVTAAPDGTATITFTASETLGYEIYFRSRSANGWVSPESEFIIPFYDYPRVIADVYVNSGSLVGGVGVPGTFTFLPPAGWAQLGGYTYSFNGSTPVFVAAGADNRATITWAPQRSGYHSLSIRAFAPDGTPAGYVVDYYHFSVA